MSDMVPVSTEGFILSAAGKEQAHVTIVESIYFQRPDGRTSPFAYQYARFLNSDEQEYSRELKLTEEWQRLDIGWIEKVGMLHIANKPAKLRVQPTQQEQQEAANRIVEVAFQQQRDGKSRDMHSPKLPPMEADCIVLPNETMRIHPTKPKTIFLRSMAGITKCIVTVIPA